MIHEKTDLRSDDRSPAHVPGISVNRRAFMNTIVALPIAAAMPTTAPPGDRPELPAGWPEMIDPAIAAADVAIKVWEKFEVACSAESKAEEVVIDWKNLHPRPALRGHVVGSDADFKAFQAGQSSYDPNADLREAVKEQEAAVTEWGKARKEVERACGYTRAQRAHRKMSDLFTEACDELIAARPTSLAGLQAKARAARLSHDEGIQQQIVFDIAVLFGELDQNERPFEV
jgi:hypothetical protein